MFVNIKIYEQNKIRGIIVSAMDVAGNVSTVASEEIQIGVGGSCAHAFFCTPHILIKG
jgi:hypothetical protein